MSTKARLISTISAICMILALLVTGVWAVSTANITLGGTISFKADNVNATVSGTITGTQESITLPDISYDAETDTTSTEFQANVAKWSNNSLTFTDANEIKMTITVQNKSTERSLFVKVTDNTATSNINKDFSSTVNNVGSGDTYEVVAGGEIEYTLTLSVDELDYSASATYALDVDLRDANAPAEENENTPVQLDENKKANGMTFSLDDSAFTASVSVADETVKEPAIPEKVKYNGNVYSVTSIGTDAFMNVMELTSITIPSSVTSIEVGAFYGCDSLTDVYYTGTQEQWDKIAIDSDNGPLSSATATIHIGAQVIIGIDEANVDTLTEAIIPAVVQYKGKEYSVTSIGTDSFIYAHVLSKVIIPTSVTSIEIGAFYGCDNLTDIYYTGTQEQWEKIAIDSDNGPLSLGTVTIHYGHVVVGTESPVILDENKQANGITYFVPGC